MIGFAFVAKAQSVEIYDVDPKGDGKIEVTVKVWGENVVKHTYRVKVTPEKEVWGVVVESAKFVDVTADSSGNTGKVTFNCGTTSKGEAEMCKRYYFKAELVRY